METYSVTEARRQFSQIINSGETIEVTHPKHPIIIIPKEKFQALEDELLMREMDEALERAKGQKRYTSDEVDAIMAEILNRTQEK
ncbi:hypothetical protein WDW89_24560 [Deltaproteobacteria bacterium TL4]